MKNKVYIYHGDGDYTPVLVIHNEKVILKGDNVHDCNYMDFAEGFAKGNKAEVVSVWIETRESFEDNKSLFEKYNLTDEFEMCVYE